MKYRSSVKDESLIEKRREQMIRGAVTFLKKKASTEQLREKLRKKLDSVLEHCMNTFERRKMCSILFATVFTTKYITGSSQISHEKGTIDGLTTSHSPLLWGN